MAGAEGAEEKMFPTLLRLEDLLYRVGPICFRCCDGISPLPRLAVDVERRSPQGWVDTDVKDRLPHWQCPTTRDSRKQLAVVAPIKSRIFVINAK